jgi:NADPH-dependent 2,4-dienoyl-CoA reductase/sulfur reductase-like enzyme
MARRHDRSLNAVVIVGASLAGYRTAQALREFGFRGSLHLVGEEPHLPYSRPPLSKHYLARTSDESSIWLATLLELDALDLALGLGRTAVNVDLSARYVELDDGERLAYDALVVATGARPRLIAGLTETSRPPSVHTLRTIEDARRLSDVLRPHPDGRPTDVVVVGSGFIGSEVTSTSLGLGAYVTLVDSGEAPMSAVLHSEMGHILARRHRKAGVNLRSNATVREIMVDPAADSNISTEVRLTSGESLAADAVVVGVGVTPTTGWLQGSGLQLDDGLVCDETLQAYEGVFAAGDVTRWGPPGEPGRRLEHWTNAVAQAEHVARNIMAGPDATPFENIPYYWSDQFGFRLDVVGEPPAGCDLDFVWGTPQTASLVALYRKGAEVLGVVAVDARHQMVTVRRALRGASSWATALDAIAW